MNYHDLTSWRHWNDGNWIWGIIPLNGRMTTVLSGQWIIQPESWKKCVFATWTWKDSWHPTRNKYWGIHRLNYGSLLLSMWLVHPDISRYFLSFRNPLNDILTFWDGGSRICFNNSISGLAGRSPPADFEGVFTFIFFWMLISVWGSDRWLFMTVPYFSCSWFEVLQGSLCQCDVRWT